MAMTINNHNSIFLLKPVISPNVMPHHGVPVCPKILRQRPGKTKVENGSG
jgi:hypothetical protein